MADVAIWEDIDLVDLWEVLHLAEQDTISRSNGPVYERRMALIQRLKNGMPQPLSVAQKSELGVRVFGEA